MNMTVVGGKFKDDLKKKIKEIKWKKKSLRGMFKYICNM